MAAMNKRQHDRWIMGSVYSLDMCGRERAASGLEDGEPDLRLNAVRQRQARRCGKRSAASPSLHHREPRGSDHRRTGEDAKCG